ncbi:MAG: S-layer homology domain-containing protein [Oscillospiraceae bacterium]|jgi:hypothetical protein|nr:S-layer homology domain-containing protein [Oscillospiraceae bacterium]
MKKILSALLAFVFAALCAPRVAAKTTPAGQTVGSVLFYVTNDKEEEILVSQIPVSVMEADMKAGKIDDTVHNYSLLDRFVTTLHQEAQGFTVMEFIDYARGKSTLDALRETPLSLSGKSEVSFWEIDQTGYDELDTYTYGELYGTPRYNFPLLYEYWDYEKQDYYDPEGKLTREQVVDKIFANGVPETVILSVRAFSQRYMVTSEKFRVDYNMENYWNERQLLDNERTIRLMKPMTRAELYDKTPTASDTRYWTANIRLSMDAAPDIESRGEVAAPTAVMTEADDSYYIRFNCATPGATILYNHNFVSPSYTPTSPYGDGPVIVPKEYFKSGKVTMTARAVREGYTDAGVVTLTLESSGREENPESHSAYSDVPEDAWYATAVDYVMDNGLYDLTGKNAFSPDAPMTRAMLVTALYRLEDSPVGALTNKFSDITRGTPLSAAVSWAYDAGIVSGYPDGTFKPDDRITRQEIAAMICRYSAEIGGGRTETDSSEYERFTDIGEVAYWAEDEMRWAVGAGVINGMDDGTVSPRGVATRAQVAQMLLNYRQAAR